MLPCWGEFGQPTEASIGTCAAHAERKKHMTKRLASQFLHLTIGLVLATCAAPAWAVCDPELNTVHGTIRTVDGQPYPYPVIGMTAECTPGSSPCATKNETVQYAAPAMHLGVGKFVFQA